MATGARFLGKVGSGECQRCSREIATSYLVEVGDDQLRLGRRCAARAMGWATSKVEMEAKAIARRQVIAARTAVLVDAFPTLPTAWVKEIRCHDYLWGEDGGWRQLAQAEA